MKNRILEQGFTLFEILVVISIIALLASAATISYRTASMSSRDARRKADLEQIRGALELYRSNNNTYPATLSADCAVSGGLTDGSGNTYMSTVPHDPKCSGQTYYYTQLSSGADYTLGAYLESGGSTCTISYSCASGGGKTCNYCVGPYGQK